MFWLFLLLMDFGAFQIQTHNFPAVDSVISEHASGYKVPKHNLQRESFTFTKILGIATCFCHCQERCIHGRILQFRKNLQGAESKRTHQLWLPQWSYLHHSLLWHLSLSDGMCMSLPPGWRGKAQGDGLNYLTPPGNLSKTNIKKQTRPCRFDPYTTYWAASLHTAISVQEPMSNSPRSYLPKSLAKPHYIFHTSAMLHIPITKTMFAGLTPAAGLPSSRVHR